MRWAELAKKSFANEEAFPLIYKESICQLIGGLLHISMYLLYIRRVTVKVVPAFVSFKQEWLSPPVTSADIGAAEESIIYH